MICDTPVSAVTLLIFLLKKITIQIILFLNLKTKIIPTISDDGQHYMCSKCLGVTHNKRK